MITINCNGKLIDLSSTKIMGIVNLTPDSFYDGGENFSSSQILKNVEKLILEGADFIDLGGCSTRPGADVVNLEEERSRVIPALKSIKKEFPDALISIDTFRSEIAKEAINEGAHMINDVMGGSFDKNMFAVVSELKVPYILMHSNGIPTINQKSRYKENGLIAELNYFFSEKIQELRSYGLNDLILDPGFGFGKTSEENLSLIKNLSLIGFGKFPLLIGLSRKSTIQKILDCKALEALNGTSVLHTLALLEGASILRVHDIKEAKECVKLVEAYKKVD